MQYSLRVFANDGTIDSDELAMLERLALRDGTVNEDERAVLTQSFPSRRARHRRPERLARDLPIQGRAQHFLRGLARGRWRNVCGAGDPLEYQA